ncbi:hypothetical protein ACFQ14_03125 [Pseudahrensia aquimaris]|uniref:Uncharacterized protein n=1 Tax=Pseudahrensia aquimaris TaxID=744461 RepID=A0ABW3FAA7_9HYPH
MPNLSIKVDRALISDVQPLLGSIEDTLAATYGIAVDKCNVMVCEMDTAPHACPIYIEFVYRESATNGADKIAMVGKQIAECLKPMEARIAFRAFAMTAETLLSKNF